MRGLIESMMVVSATVMAAAVVALGAPALAELALVEAVRHGPDAAAVRDAAAGLLQIVWSAAGSMSGR
jgi:hypothetical protein